MEIETTDEGYFTRNREILEYYEPFLGKETAQYKYAQKFTKFNENLIKLASTPILKHLDIEKEMKTCLEDLFPQKNNESELDKDLDDQINTVKEELKKINDILIQSINTSDIALSLKLKTWLIPRNIYSTDEEKTFNDYALKIYKTNISKNLESNDHRVRFNAVFASSAYISYVKEKNEKETIYQMIKSIIKIILPRIFLSRQYPKESKVLSADELKGMKDNARKDYFALRDLLGYTDGQMFCAEFAADIFDYYKAQMVIDEADVKSSLEQFLTQILKDAKSEIKNVAWISLKNYIQKIDHSKIKDLFKYILSYLVIDFKSSQEAKDLVKTIKSLIPEDDYKSFLQNQKLTESELKILHEI